ncbi:MAG: hypothetical protein Q4C65_02660 [Eubacteriales bacterium]|nr:hypothetical protein [Eubacteriales bacterium]
MDYETLLKRMGELPKDKMKEKILYVDQDFIDKIKSLDIDDEAKRKLILASKDRTFFEMLLVNVLM